MSAFETIVIGVGTDLRGDDGFGGAVIEALRKQPALADRAVLAHCDGEPGRMIDLWDGFRHALVIDAVRGGSERFGFVYRHEFASGVTSGSARQRRETVPGGEPVGNGHAIGLGAAVRLGRVLDRLPGRLILYAVHGRDFRLGAPLSGPVAQAVPALAGRISREILGVLSLGEGRDQGPRAGRSSGPVRVLPPRATL